MALTATASSDTRSDIVATLCMDHPAIISASPHKKNIMYIVKEKSTLEDLVKVVSEALIALRTSMPDLSFFASGIQNVPECTVFTVIISAITSPNHPGALTLQRAELWTCTANVRRPV